MKETLAKRKKEGRNQLSQCLEIDICFIPQIIIAALYSSSIPNLTGSTLFISIIRCQKSQFRRFCEIQYKMIKRTEKNV
ncbi:hypothetical protein BpHYR1_021221 [Brachionus plicatilis]|uniref:Uncharacterized protein n=1 Tax=Brachionus plicatilis TaxID=10195 RepID=A0A3M7T2M8_BRAPC|nr:hypothetical protein BpHYR1_021221 [Brachionus plicatilis]